MVFQSCGNPTSSDLNYKDFTYYYKGELFTGITEDYSNEDFLKYYVEYFNGKKHTEKEFNPNGTLRYEQIHYNYHFPSGIKRLLRSRRDFTNTGVKERSETCINTMKDNILTIETTIEFYDWCGELKRIKKM